MPRVYPDKHYVIRRCIKLTLFHPHGFSRSSHRSGGGNLFLATARDQKSRYVYEVFSAPRAKRESNAGPSTEEHLVIDSISKQTWGGEREKKRKKNLPQAHRCARGAGRGGRSRSMRGTLPKFERCGETNGVFRRFYFYSI